MYGQNRNDNRNFIRSQQEEKLRLQKQLNDIQIQNATRPAARTFDSQLDGSGQIREGLRLKNNVNTGALDQLREESMREAGTPSAWRGLIDDKITREAGQQNANLQAQQNRALDNLAMRGGASSGAAERMAAAGVGQGLQAQQNIFGNRLEADLQDEQMRTSGLQNLVGMENQAGEIQNKVDSLNLNAAAQERLQKRAFDTNNYNEQMRAWASEQTAAATPSGGGGKK